jgi:hypothetical protein
MKNVMTVEQPIYTETLPPKIAILEDPVAHSPEQVQRALWYAFGAMCSIREHPDSQDTLDPLLRRMALLGANAPEPLKQGLLRLAEQTQAFIDGRDFKPTLPGDISVGTSRQQEASELIFFDALLAAQAEQQELLNRQPSVEAVVRMAAAKFGRYPQYGGYWQDSSWSLVRLNRRVRSRHRLVQFERGDFTIARPAPPGLKKAGDVEAYSVRAGSNMVLPISYVEGVEDLGNTPVAATDSVTTRRMRPLLRLVKR